MSFYRALLYLYPKSFRAEYGEEMSAVFAREWRSASDGDIHHCRSRAAAPAAVCGSRSAGETVADPGVARPGNLTVFAAAVALSLIMTIAGSLMPAWRAVRVDPLTATRAD